MSVWRPRGTLLRLLRHDEGASFRGRRELREHLRRPIFIQALKNTRVYIVASTILITEVALALALGTRVRGTHDRFRSGDNQRLTTRTLG